MDMEIRNALKKIDNYLSVVQNLNKTILEEGTMAPDELKLMKKYLYSCIDRIEELEQKLGFLETTTEESETVVPEMKQEAEIPVVNLITEQETVSEILPETEEIIQEPVHFAESTVEPEPVLNNIIEEVAEKTETPVAEEITAEENAQTQVIVEEVFIKTETTSFQLVGEEEAGEKIIGHEEKRTWADLWEDKKEPLSNGLVAEEEEETVVQLTQTPEAVVTEVQEQILAEEYKPLVASQEEEEEEVHSFIGKKEETTVNDVLQNSRQTGLFETFNSGIQETVHVKTYSAETKIENVSEPDVIVAEIEHKQPEFNLESIFNQVKTGSEERIKSAKTLSESIALNDKFIFVRELFGNQFNEYENALRTLDGLNSYAEAEQFCNQQLHGKFKWNERPANVERFYALIEKRFTA